MNTKLVNFNEKQNTLDKEIADFLEKLITIVNNVFYKHYKKNSDSSCFTRTLKRNDENIIWMRIDENTAYYITYMDGVISFYSKKDDTLLMVFHSIEEFEENFPKTFESNAVKKWRV